MNINVELKNSGTAGLRMTKQRMLIHEELAKLYSHPTADEIHKIVKRKIPNISLGTVYRNLELLAKSGLIRKLELGLDQRRYDAHMEDHSHIVCISCGKVSDIPADAVTINRSKVSEASEYKVLRSEVEFLGICPECTNKGLKA
jgi:Fur family transcriptional regulator, ferric uptake regulator